VSRALHIDIVMPVFNEGANIGITLDALARGIARVETGAATFALTVVYDFDSDDTLPALHAVRARYPFPITEIKNEKRGFAHALRTGFAKASGDYVLVTMADSSDDYRVLPQMVTLAHRGADVIAPSRYAKGGRRIGGSVLKQALSLVAGASVSKLAGMPITDITNNYKLYKTRPLKELRLESDKGGEIALEITARLHVRGGVIAEVPTTWRERGSGKSKFKLLRWLPGYLRWYGYLLVPGMLRAFFHKRSAAAGRPAIAGSFISDGSNGTDTELGIAMQKTALGKTTGTF
jgi:dolichol-phosphate mannosyltransferase